jgi:glycosyltransferase involved in cell wall biosynthesis
VSRPSRPEDDGPHVLRLCSVFEPLPAPGRAGPGALPGELDARAARFDPVGGMQNHTGTLTRCLDASGVRQTVITSRLAGPRGRRPLGRATRVVRTGLPVARLRQLWALCALPAALRPGTPVDVVHAHQGEDLATLPLARLAARRHRCPLVVNVHCSVGHTVRGGGPRERLLHVVGTRLDARSQAAERISLAGFVEHRQVPGVLAALDVLVLPSAYEEMGSVLVEAMAAGLPVVASDVGGIPAVVRDGRTGLLVPPGDTDALAAALDRLVADPALRERLAAGARARARDFAWPQLAARVAAVYAGVRGARLPVPAAA